MMQKVNDRWPSVYGGRLQVCLRYLLFFHDSRSEQDHFMSWAALRGKFRHDRGVGVT
jgi:hypothetical protein